ncbi:MAG: DNA polymerase III subunit gamma/tau [Bacteroidales bacterium]|nr:DNA polymerase III subunit gamma/tau [Bacteroidales bacterium]
MSDYVVSARKYRPESFGTLFGQDNISRTLKNSISRGQLAHAYLFCGPRGVGKTSMARLFAKAINCSSPSADMDPCGECESCRSFAEGRSYCIHELDAASNNGVENVKALLDQVQIPPQTGKYSVYIIDEVHMLTGAAFNAFLKTLEEPPAYAVFILCTTEKHKILPTILSRCQTYDFNRIGVPDMVRNLRDIAGKEGVTIDDKSLHVIAQKADGAMRDALTLFDQTVAFCGQDVHYEDVIRNLNVLDYAYSFRLVDAFLAGDYASALLTFDEILSKGFNAQYFVAALSSHLRDLLVCRTGGLEALLDIPESLRELYSGQAAKCGVKFLFDALGITAQCESGYRTALNPRLHVEYALMRLSFLLGAPATAADPKAESSAVKVVAPKEEAPVAEPAAPTAGAPAPEVKAPVEKADPDPAPETPAPKAPTPQVAPQAASKRRPALSMASLVEDEANEAKSAELSSGGVPEEEDILGAWKQVVSEKSDRINLFKTLDSAKTRVEDGDGFRTLTFTVFNEAQRGWIVEKVLGGLEVRLRSILLTDKVRLCVDVIPDEEVEKKAYLPEEKARELMQKNPEVKEFVIDLGLDIK